MILNRDDGFIKVYEMLSGGKGNLINPSLGWQYVQNISIGDAQSVSRHPRLGSTSQRIVTKGSDTTLTIGRWHVGGDEFKFANENKEYIIDLLFYDFLTGETETTAHTIQLAYCKPIGRDFVSDMKANMVTRKWGVGEVTDSAIGETTVVKLAKQATPFTNVASIVYNHSLDIIHAWVHDTNGKEIGVAPTITASVVTFDFTRSRSGTWYYIHETT